MDGNRFDALTRRMASTASRRTVLAGAAAGLLGAFGFRRTTWGQVTQVQCGNKLCRSNPGVCAAGCVCCQYGNGNNRCQPPGTCGSGTATCPSDRPFVEPVLGCVSCLSAANCPVPTAPCQVATCSAGVCGQAQAANTTPCDDGDPCTDGGVCVDGACVGTPMDCPTCQACVGGACQPVDRDPACGTQCCGGSCCPASHTCIGNACQPVCLSLRSVCNPMAPPACCQDHPTECSVEANCTTAQEDARCCRSFGQPCGDRCDCCGNADCVGGTCQLATGQQCLDASECAGLVPGCCGGVCRELADDVSHCGQCGNTCPASTDPNADASCFLGNCITICRDGFTFCNDACVPLASDETNCGACGNACPGGQTCCNGVCRDLANDENNCGGCGFLCPGTCCNGDCQDLLTDEQNCGACGHNCFFEICGQSFCPGAVTECCSGGCRDLSSDETNCGACDRECPLGHECTGSVCLAIN